MEDSYSMNDFRIINILVVEDCSAFCLLISEYLAESKLIKFQIAPEKNLTDACTYLDGHDCDVILLDLHLPDSAGFDTFDKIHQTAPNLPIILLTGLNDQELAIKLIKSGAQDYLLKDETTPGSVERSIHYAIERKHLELEQKRLTEELHKALDNIKILRGLLPICACCKKIRDDNGYWNEVESYMRKHSEVTFTHGYCPDCYEKEIRALKESKSILDRLPCTKEIKGPKSSTPE